MLDLPGIERDALEISLDDDRLVDARRARAAERARATRRAPAGRFLAASACLERRSRTITADYKDGVLRCVCPSAGAKGRAAWRSSKCSEKVTSET